MKVIRLALFILLFGLFFPTEHGAANLPPQDTLRQWIHDMQDSPRGPFARIRWFCSDGSILPPRPYACKDHDGGVQHGEWTDRVKKLREKGYYISTVLASLDQEPITSAPGYSDLYNQLLIEKFLVGADDGWIFRKARYYRGAFQAEDEAASAQELLLGLAEQDIWITRGFLPLRIGSNLLEHGAETASVSKVRQQSLALSEKDTSFLPLRVKIHNQPDRIDARRVRDYAAGLDDPALATEYIRLAEEIDQIFMSKAATQKLEEIKDQLRAQPIYAHEIQAMITDLKEKKDPLALFTAASKNMAAIRELLPRLSGASLRLGLMDTSRVIELEQFTAGRTLLEVLPTATRRERLQWLKSNSYAIYGAGLISASQLEDIQHALTAIDLPRTSLAHYRETLAYLGRVPGWGTQWLRFHFQESVQKLAELDPLAKRFTQDQLRGSPLFFYAHILDSLQRDANKQVGFGHRFFNQTINSGLRGLNPGLARGTLRLKADTHSDSLDRHGIYLLSETIAELPPIAGILTASEGNPLSHVQLLARNLGIPNVIVDASLIPTLTSYQGQPVILAVSPAGSVQLVLDKGQLDQVFAQQTTVTNRIRPDLQKLDLTTRNLIPLSQLRAADSGRIVGPKAANLGELYHQFPDAVAEGLVIPFGVFRSLLDQPMPDSSLTFFAWMEKQYQTIQALPTGSPEAEQKLEAVRSQLEAHLLHVILDDKFRHQLRIAMEKVFGPEGTYGVFVRSDTNVEDLPGFTGAGLNKTIPHVVGFDYVLAAIPKVWASPFSQRAFAWRQALMELPQHVYASILLMRSVPAEKSGVMVTRDIDTGDPKWLTIAVNEGIGGAVDGQAAESLRVHSQTGKVRTIAQATSPWRRVLNSRGGIAQEQVKFPQRVLKPGEIKQLISMAHELPLRYPSLVDDHGIPVPADIEFGFVQEKLQLFQIRPFLESTEARSNQYLNELDKDRQPQPNQMVNLDEPPS
ncbi:MAG: hypothetical protein GY799_16650 [Desulfobulbaceae bacterium]|nr:hypothetical protein [Desulfobulbaceae bacterium]